MTAELDPRRTEPQSLLAAVDFSAKRVLEIGTGNGRLMFRVAEAPRFMAAIDLDVGGVVSASRSRPVHLKRRLSFLAAGAMGLPFRRRTFDIALLGWSL